MRSAHADKFFFKTIADGNTIVSGDVNGDGAADFAIRLTGNLLLTSADFVL